MRRRAGRFVVVGAVLAAGALMSLAASAGPASAAANKPFSVVVAPPSMQGGITTTVNVTLNAPAQQGLGSANLFPPSVLTVSGATTCATGNGSAPCIQLRNLAIPAGGSKTVTLTVVSACGAGSGSWNVQAKQANDFNGNGNDLTLDVAHSKLTTTDTGGCIVSALTNCATTGCRVNPSAPAGSLTATASGTSSSPGTLQAAVLSGALSCNGYSETDLQLHPNTYEVVASASGFSKTLSIEFPAPSNAPPVESGDTDFGTPGGDRDFDYDDVLWRSQVCFQAPYAFMARNGSTASFDSSTGLYTGLLPDCPMPLSSATGPCHDRAADTVTNVGADNTTSYDIVLGVFVPAGQAGDPRMN